MRTDVKEIFAEQTSCDRHIWFLIEEPQVDSTIDTVILPGPQG